MMNIDVDVPIHACGLGLMMSTVPVTGMVMIMTVIMALVTACEGERQQAGE